MDSFMKKYGGFVVLVAAVVVGIVLWLAQSQTQQRTEQIPETRAVATSSAFAAKSPGPTPRFTRFACEDELGCVDIRPSDPIHVAYMLVITGDIAALGLDAKFGSEIAIDDVGGKLFGHAIEFDGQDSACSAAGGQAAAAKIVSDKPVVGVIGPSWSTEARTAASIITQAGLSMVSPSSIGPDLTDPAKHQAGFLRTAFNGKAQGVSAAQFVYTQLNLTRAATIHDGSTFAQALAQAFTETFRKLGGSITSEEVVGVGDKDVKPALARIAAGKPDLIFYPISATEGSLIAAQIRDVKGLERTVMLSADENFSPDFLKTAGKNTIGMYFSIPDFDGFDGGYEKVVDKDQRKFNVKGTLSLFHAYAYDAMSLLLEALQKPNVVVKESDGTLHVRKQALRNALYATKDFKGITGNLSCDANGDCAGPKIAIYQATQDNFANLVMPKDPVWFPGGPDYKPNR
jgi:branched-chain amino acid transport system substrate-binding protein